MGARMFMFYVEWVSYDDQNDLISSLQQTLKISNITSYTYARTMEIGQQYTKSLVCLSVFTVWIL